MLRSWHDVVQGVAAFVPILLDNSLSLRDWLLQVALAELWSLNLILSEPSNQLLLWQTEIFTKQRVLFIEISLNVLNRRQVHRGQNRIFNDLLVLLGLEIVPFWLHFLLHLIVVLHIMENNLRIVQPTDVRATVPLFVFLVQEFDQLGLHLLLKAFNRYSFVDSILQT